MTYLEFIQRIISERGQFGISEDEVYENHHILPHCMGGLGDYKRGGFKKNSTHPNCIRLYPREHFIAHKLLALENPKNPKLVWSWQAMWMINDNYERYEPTPEEYEQRKIMLRKCGTSNETKIKQSISFSGKNNPIYGTHRTEETKNKLRKANIGKEIYWWNDGTSNTMAKECPGPNWKRGRLGGFHDKKKRHTKGHISKKYLWKTENGDFEIMDKTNAKKWHPNWKLIKEVK